MTGDAAGEGRDSTRGSTPVSMAWTVVRSRSRIVHAPDNLPTQLLPDTPCRLRLVRAKTLSKG